MDDLAILELFRKRSEEAIKECQNKYADYCYSISYGILQNREDAEECVNDTFLQAWDSIPPVVPEHLKAYLGSIARNLSINRVKSLTRQKRGEGAIPLDISELSEVIAQPGGIWEKIDEELLMKEINVFLKEQKKLYRIVFTQKYWYLLDIKRIAELNLISESKVGSILHRMRKKLKKRLEKEGYII
ncbi:MAG: RNA polymerase sigma factor [Lachnospiraceae bacterium]|nr:RNA polymerase sigma factor [Lachnospiraceae bacterium]